jgi:asparagine synthase (glutamine-hydrolysing)
MNRDIVKSLMLDFDENLSFEAPVEKLWAEVQGKDELDKKLTIDVSLWLEGDIYLNTDRTSTACGIELQQV